MHNDTQYVSHDIYNVTNSTSPGGLWALENYTVDKDISNFIGQNWAPELIPYNGSYMPNLTVHTEVDYAVAVSPITATLEGQVNFTGRGSNNTQWIEEFVVWFFDNGTKAEMAWSPINTTTDTTGFFTINGLNPGTYDIGIKGGTGLSELETNVTLTADNTTVVDFGTIRVGDANNDDYITISDRTLLYGGWNTGEGDPGWRPYCDFNNDGYITISDRTLLYGNWNEVGDLAP